MRTNCSGARSLSSICHYYLCVCVQNDHSRDSWFAPGCTVGFPAALFRLSSVVHTSLIRQHQISNNAFNLDSLMWASFLPYPCVNQQFLDPGAPCPIGKQKGVNIGASRPNVGGNKRMHGSCSTPSSSWIVGWPAIRPLILALLVLSKPIEN